MYTLKVGDELRLSGPFGDFALKPGSREKVFIGGGVGMAPLRAMIHDLLLKGANEPLHFWYGARSREFYVCGPPAMLSSTRAMLRSLGVAEANIAYDDFKI